MDETELIRAAQRGDSAAFEELVRTYDQSVLRLALSMLRSPEDARDVYQETFLRVYRNLNQFPLRLQLSHLAVPDCDESVPGPIAPAKGSQRGAGDRDHSGRNYGPRRYGGGNQGGRRSPAKSIQRADPEARERKRWGN